MRRNYSPVLIVLVMAGCAGFIGRNKLESQREHDLRVGNISSALHPEWAEADRCTKCHGVWNWEFGYYHGWDRHGFMYDYYKTAPFGYKDPWGSDAPSYNSYRDYYFTDWWRGPWLEIAERPEPPMRLDGYGIVNDGTASPRDFEGPVIVVDPAGKGDARTIQEGVDKAASGTTVFVRAGTYPECVKLREGIHLWGENPHTTIINPDFAGSAITAANGCDISGFTLTGTGMNYKEYNFNSGVHALDCDSTLVIRGNIFDSNAVFGVLVESSRAGGTPKKNEDRYISLKASLDNLDYTGYPNPRIIGNTFYVIGERAVFSIHAAPEIANNVFIGNVKTIGMTQHAHPFIHHNVFYRNNVSVNMNRSMPIMSYNIFLDNYWGQRVIEGARPVVHDNVTWNSPYYKEFREDGSQIIYPPKPGYGELSIDPKFVEPDGGDFRLASDSLLLSRTSGGKTYGLVTGNGIQQPPVVACERSFAAEFNNRNEASDAITTALKARLKKIKNVKVSYTVEYESYMKVEYDGNFDQKSATIADSPVSGVKYEVPLWIKEGDRRRKTYRSVSFLGSKTAADSGTVVFDGERLRVLSGRFRDVCQSFDDPDNIGERVFRENIGGLYLDYDQYLNGAIGPAGTFFYGYLSVFGGEVPKKRETVDGHECVVVLYPNIGVDLKYRICLDPALGYMPRKLEQYCERKIYRRIDGYKYEERDGIFLPTDVTVTDYAVRKPHIGKVVGRCRMRVKPGSLKVNDPAVRLSDAGL